MSETNLGHATAYGYAKSKGYTGTEEEFAEMLANLDSDAETASAAATSAAASATTASTKATEISDKISDANSIMTRAVINGKKRYSMQYLSTTSVSSETFNPTGYTWSEVDVFSAYKNGEKIVDSTVTAEQSGTVAIVRFDPAVTMANGDILEIVCDGGVGLSVDNTLSVDGAAADSKATGDAINDLKEDLNDIINMDVMSFNGFEQGGIHKNDNTGYMDYDVISTRCRVLVSDVKNFNIKAKTGYLFNYFICLHDSTGYKYIYSPGVWLTEATVKNDNALVWVLVRNASNSSVSPLEAKENIYYEPTFYTTHQNIENVLFRANVIPDRTYIGQCYAEVYDNIINVSNGTLKRVLIEQDTVYYVTTSFIGQTDGFPLVTYIDAEGAYISHEYMNVPGIETKITNQQITIPDRAKWFYVNSRNFDSVIQKYKVPTVTLPDVENITGEKEISILFIGNSLTQDGIAYLPYLLKHYYPEISFYFYMWYNGGYTLAQQYTKFVNNGNAEIFSVAENTDSWNNSSNMNMSQVLSSYKFDIVCLQEYFNYKENYTDVADWNNCRDYIAANYTGGNGLEFISLFHAPLRTNKESVYALTRSGNSLILKETISEDMIPIGIAIYNGMNTALDSLGDWGHLSVDGTHTQEGLPCLLQTYTALVWLLDKLSVNKSVYGLPFRVTTEIYNAINVPGPNLGSGVITGTDSENLLAQEVAIKAYKEGKKFVLENLS